MEKKRRILLNCYFIILILFIYSFSLFNVFAMGSASYNISNPTVSDGGAGSSSSSNFNLSFIFESITGALSSSSFKNWLGFFTGVSGGDRVFPLIFFINPTPANATSTSNTSLIANVSISESNLMEVKWNWNGTNFTLYNDSLVLMMNFENLSSLGENSTYVVDVSKYGNNGTFIKNNGTSSWNESGKYSGAWYFDGDGDHIQIPYSSSLNFSTNKNYSVSCWIYAKQTSNHQIFQLPMSFGDIAIINSKICFDNGAWNCSSGSISSEIWNHITIVFDRTGSSTIFINGINDSTLSTWQRNPDDDAPTYIGYDPEPYQKYLNGSIDEVRIYNRSLTSAEVYQLYVSNLMKFNSTQWYLYVNQSKNSTNPLDRGNYTYFASAKDIGLNENRTDIRLISIINAGPNAPSSVFINSTHGTNRTKEDLNCFANITDPEGDEMNVSVRWYKNGVLNLSQNYSNGVTGYANGSLFIGMLNNTNTTKGENWSCSLRLFDGLDYGSWSNVSFNLTILNSYPNVTLLMPNHGNITTNRTPIFIWNGSDDDSDALEYEINISAYYTGGGRRSVCDDYKNKAYIGTASNYTPSSYIKCLIDNGYYLNWSVRAYDGAVYGNWTLNWNLSINSVITISLPVNITNFGVLRLLVFDNTSDNSPPPLVLRNDGNADVNISVNFTNLWTTVSIPNESLQFKIRNLTSKCFVDSGTTTLWTNAPVITTRAINRLNFTSGYQEGCNNVSVDIYLKVPVSEPAGNKNSTVAFTSSLAEPGYGAD